jgi:hypothetical protein
MKGRMLDPVAWKRNLPPFANTACINAASSSLGTTSNFGGSGFNPWVTKSPPFMYCNQLSQNPSLKLAENRNG